MKITKNKELWLPISIVVISAILLSLAFGWIGLVMAVIISFTIGLFTFVFRKETKDTQVKARSGLENLLASKLQAILRESRAKIAVFRNFGEGLPVLEKNIESDLYLYDSRGVIIKKIHGGTDLEKTKQELLCGKYAYALHASVAPFEFFGEIALNETHSGPYKVHAKAKYVCGHVLYVLPYRL